jgi:arsenate reductase
MQPTPSKPDILFLCVANSARSQLAEGWARRLAPAGVTVHSAGSEPGRLHPGAVAVMAEVGIDLAGQYSKPITDVPLERVGTVVTLCADEVCPVLPGDVARHHWPLEDPAGAGSDEELLVRFRLARDEIERRLRAFFPAPERSVNGAAGG